MSRANQIIEKLQKLREDLNGKKFKLVDIDGAWVKMPQAHKLILDLFERKNLAKVLGEPTTDYSKVTDHEEQLKVSAGEINVIFTNDCSEKAGSYFVTLENNGLFFGSAFILPK